MVLSYFQTNKQKKKISDYYFLPLNQWKSCTKLCVHQDTTIELTANQNGEQLQLIYRCNAWTQRHGDSWTLYFYA